MTLVSVAVCVRDGIGWIDGCLESLVNQSHSPIEIILVDDGSTDRTKELLKDRDDIILISRDINRGYGFSIKEGIQKSTGDLILIIDLLFEHLVYLCLNQLHLVLYE